MLPAFNESFPTLPVALANSVICLALIESSKLTRKRFLLKLGQYFVAMSFQSFLKLKIEESIRRRRKFFPPSHESRESRALGYIRSQCNNFFGQ